MGYNDAINAVNQPSSAQDTLSYFALKKKQDSRVSGVSFEKFQELQALGHFDDFKYLDDKLLKAQFLQ